MKTGVSQALLHHAEPERQRGTNRSNCQLLRNNLCCSLSNAPKCSAPKNWYPGGLGLGSAVSSVLTFMQGGDSVVAMLQIRKLRQKKLEVERIGF